MLSAAGQAAPVKTSGSGYLVETAADELDVTRFRALCDSGRKAADRKDWGAPHAPPDPQRGPVLDYRAGSAADYAAGSAGAG